MEKDIGKIKKSETTDVVVRIDDFGGKTGLTIREFVTGDRYTGFTKSGTRIPAEKFLDFRELINSVNIADLQAEKATETKEEKQAEITEEKPKRGRKKKEAKEETLEEAKDEELL